jgi:hypothetical protein
MAVLYNEHWCRGETRLAPGMVRETREHHRRIASVDKMVGDPAL